MPRPVFRTGTPNQAAVGGTGEYAGRGGSTTNNPQTSWTAVCRGSCGLARNQLPVCSILVNRMPHLALACARSADCHIESVGFRGDAWRLHCFRRERRSAGRGGSTANNRHTAVMAGCCGSCGLTRNHASACSVLANRMPNLALTYARTADCHIEGAGFPEKERSAPCSWRETRLELADILIAFLDRGRSFRRFRVIADLWDCSNPPAPAELSLLLK
jgi:hypothetical protein